MGWWQEPLNLLCLEGALAGTGRMWWVLGGNAMIVALRSASCAAAGQVGYRVELLLQADHVHPSRGSGHMEDRRNLGSWFSTERSLLPPKHWTGCPECCVEPSLVQMPPTEHSQA